MRAIVGLFGRLVFFLGLIYIVGHAVVSSWRSGGHLWAVLEIGFFPLTYAIWPWFSGLWWVLLVSLGGYWASTFIGRMPPVD